MRKIVAGICILVGFVVVLALLLQGHTIDVLQPAGIVADKQKHLIIIATLLAIIVVIPVYALTIGVAWKYRASNKKARYTPDWDHDKLIEGVWWGIPIILIGILSVITWQSSHELDPFRAIKSDKPTQKIQVVALQWKWLFIYPEEKIATVNFVHIPVDRPVDFEITADAPMNSFWIPQLGGQIYAMSGMTTHLHLQASKAGTYQGSSANISGEGFADMRFTTEAESEGDFQEWIEDAKTSKDVLDTTAYKTLAAPSRNNNKTTYVLADEKLFDTVIMKFMGHEPDAQRSFESHLHRQVMQ